MKGRKSTAIWQLIPKVNVDRTKGVIKDIVIIEGGLDANGDNIDDTALNQILSLGNQQTQGVKSRFGHPNMCDTAPGAYIGRYKDHRIINENGKAKVIADLYLSDVCKNSPGRGDVYNYILDMAEKEHDMFGNSIEFRRDKPFVQVEKVGDEEIRTEFVRFKTYVASDLVDSPAATESLFKADDDYAAKATEFFNENPEILDIIDANPEILEDFLTKYENYKSMKAKETPKTETTVELTTVASLKTSIQSGFDGIMKFLQGDKKGTIPFKTNEGDNYEVDDSDGDGKPMVGDKVTVNGAPAPDGDYELASGQTHTVEGGSIKSMKDTEDETEEEDNEMSTCKSVDEKVILLKKRLKSKDEELKTAQNEIAGFKTTMEDFEKKLEKVSAQVKSTYVPQQRTGTDKPPVGTTGAAGPVNRIKKAGDKYKALKAETTETK